MYHSSSCIFVRTVSFSKFISMLRNMNGTWLTTDIMIYNDLIVHQLFKSVYGHLWLIGITKLMVYTAVAILTLLYTCTLRYRQLEIWNSPSNHTSSNSAEHVTKPDYEQRCFSHKDGSIYAILTCHRLRYVGHLPRMPDIRLRNIYLLQARIK